MKYFLNFWTTIPFIIYISHQPVGIVVNCMSIQAQLDSMISNGLLARPHPNLYILGTVHIGSRSADDVQVLIDTVKPSSVIVEMPPSRLKRIQQKAAKLDTTATATTATTTHRDETTLNNNNPTITTTTTTTTTTISKQTNVLDAIKTFPVFASAGWEKAGFSGLLFSTVIVWSSLLKRSSTNSEEAQSLPRRNEFNAAIIAAERVQANIIPADLEFEDLISLVGKSMTPLNWFHLGMTILSESTGIRPSDPIRRGKDESMVNWENRRRDVKTARASRAHGEYATPELSNVLVQYRDAQFARICLEMLDANVEKGGGTTVCIVGLVHLDGVVDICCRDNNIINDAAHSL